MTAMQLKQCFWHILDFATSPNQRLNYTSVKREALTFSQGKASLTHVDASA